QAQGQRQHHGGGGGVADPHRQGGGGQQQQQHADSQRAARQVQQAAGNPAVDTLGLQGAGQGKAAEENGDYRVGEMAQRRRHIQQAEADGQQRHQQGGKGQVKGFGQPQAADQHKNKQPGLHRRGQFA